MGRARLSARRLVTGAVLCGAASLSGCATLRTTLEGYEVGPAGIARAQYRLREALASGDFVQALAWREDDALLDRLSRATAAYYAGQFERAGALLDTAALVSDDRITERLARDALAILTNDNARPWRPSRTERLFIPYYGMLAYGRAERWDDAAVEARRLLALLAQADEGRDGDERALHAALEHLAAIVLQQAGRGDEAVVAYRAAHRMHDSAPERVAPLAAGQGELVVVLERGFAAHRVTERIDIWLGDDESQRRDGDPRRAEDDRRARDASPMQVDPRHPTRAESAVGPIAGPSGEPTGRRRRTHDDDSEYWIAVAFPALRRSTRPWGSAAQVAVEGSEEPTVRLAAVVDDAAAADERRDRLAMLARATARAGAKYALAKAARDKKGEVAGTLANYGASLLERADVRSWHLLPQEIQVVRTRLPAGSHAVRLQVLEGSAARVLELGRVTVRAGTTTIAAFRAWREDPPESVAAAR